MRVVGKTDIYTTEPEVLAGTGDIIHITEQGMYCKWRNGETQPDGKCLDYEIRMCCSTTSTTTTATTAPTAKSKYKILQSSTQALSQA